MKSSNNNTFFYLIVAAVIAVAAYAVYNYKFANQGMVKETPTELVTEMVTEVVEHEHAPAAEAREIVETEVVETTREVEARAE